MESLDGERLGVEFRLRTLLLLFVSKIDGLDLDMRKTNKLNKRIDWTEYLLLRAGKRKIFEGIGGFGLHRSFRN